MRQVNKNARPKNGRAREREVKALYFFGATTGLMVEPAG
jgi:hypothetical protein